MAEKTDEQLSALIDGECDKAELDLALRRLAVDLDLKERWQRYHLIGDTIRNYLPDTISTDFSKRINAAINVEPPLKSTPGTALASWYKPLAGFGLAASVALIAVLGLKYPTEPISPPPPLVDNNTQTPDNGIPDNRIQTVAIDPSLEARLNDYIVNHSEYTSMNSMHGVLPLVRIVGYQPNP